MEDNKARETLNDAMTAWVEEDMENRVVFMALGNDEEKMTTGAMFGREDKIVSALVNEMFCDPDIARVMLTSTKIYNLTLEEQEKENRGKDVRATNKTNKVVS